jgi:hypothetical protein
MKINFAQIYEGWHNLLIPPEEIKEKIAEVAKERLNICELCEYNSKFHTSIRLDEYCTKCKCTLSAKTACLSCECPLPIPKWKAEITNDEEIFLKTRDDERNKGK